MAVLKMFFACQPPGALPADVYKRVGAYDDRGNERNGNLSGTDKIKNHGEKVIGRAKEAVGDATDNDKLQAEGRAGQTKADLKQAGDDIKDAFRG